jgi:hypothetical protein
MAARRSLVLLEQFQSSIDFQIAKDFAATQSWMST